MAEKHVGVLAVSVALTAALGCGDGSVRSGGDGAGNPGGDTTRDAESPGGETEYRFVSYEVFFNTLTEVLGLTQTGSTGDDVPLTDPVGFLEVNKSSVGAATYDVDTVDSVRVGGVVTSLGMKTWILASSSACGKALTLDTKRAELFPQGPENFNAIYLTFLGRMPAEEEIAALAQLKDELAAAGGFSADSSTWTAVEEARYTSAVCAGVLGTVEFMTIN